MGVTYEAVHSAFCWCRSQSTRSAKIPNLHSRIQWSWYMRKQRQVIGFRARLKEWTLARGLRYVKANIHTLASFWCPFGKDGQKNTQEDPAKERRERAYCLAMTRLNVAMVLLWRHSQQYHAPYSHKHGFWAYYSAAQVQVFSSECGQSWRRSARAHL